MKWAVRADDGPFSSVGVLDRGIAPGLEPLAVLAAVAGVTKRVRLMTSVVVGPMRETTLLARQATTIDAISGGRLSLGLGIGVRPSDYAASGFDFRTRGARLDRELPRLRRMLQGESLSEEIGPVGSPPVRSGGVEVLIGGYVPAVARRIAAWGDGLMSPGGGDLRDMTQLRAQIERAWQEAGRGGSPRWVAASYFALGPDADEHAVVYINSMYGYDEALAARRLAMIPTSPGALQSLVQACAAAGVDELLLRPCHAGLDQLDRLSDVVS
jgi:alkanesulfonate monooxygenase SsuD/methylene tetrahydromethanopterin reductase-like flavin-dependent oxidoreductase (luciferase family)